MSRAQGQSDPLLGAGGRPELCPVLFAGHSLSSGPCPCPWGLQISVPDASGVLKPHRPQTRPFSSRGETLFLWGHRPDIPCRPVALPLLHLLPRRPVGMDPTQGVYCWEGLQQPPGPSHQARSSEHSCVLRGVPQLAHRGAAQIS